MLIVAVLEILRRNALGGAAFGTYGSFWISVGVCKLTGLRARLKVAGRAAGPAVAASCSGGRHRSGGKPQPTPPCPLLPAPPLPADGIIRTAGGRTELGRGMGGCSWLHAWEQSCLAAWCSLDYSATLFLTATRSAAISTCLMTALIPPVCISLPTGIFFLDAPKGQEALTALFGVASIGFMVRCLAASPCHQGQC